MGVRCVEASRCLGGGVARIGISGVFGVLEVLGCIRGIGVVGVKWLIPAYISRTNFVRVALGLMALIALTTLNVSNASHLYASTTIPCDVQYSHNSVRVM